MSQNVSNQLTFKKIFIFWLPLVGTWLMMSVEGPYLSAIIARLPDPEFNLAAYGVAFAFALILEAPIIMIMSASTALAKNLNSFVKLRNFTYTLNLLLTGLMVVFIVPPVFNFISLDLIELPPYVASLTHRSVILLLPWPAAIGYRRFYQGLLIRNNQTRRVAYGTVIRLVVMSSTAIILYLFANIEGVLVGTVSLSVGVIAEALASRMMAANALRILYSKTDVTEKYLGYREISKFYFPLAFTSIISLGVHPIVTFFMGQGRMPLESLAVLPVVNALVFIFRSVGLSFQEVVIALIGDNFEHYVSLKKFALIFGTGATAMLGFAAYTPLADLWLINIAGLNNYLAEFANLPLKIIFIMPELTFLISFQRALLVKSHNTKHITFATSSEVITIILVLLLAINFLDWVGVVAAMTAFVTGRLIANILLLRPCKAALSN